MPPLSGIARYVQEFEKSSPPERKMEKTTKEIHEEQNAAKRKNNKEALKEKIKEW